MLQFKEIVQRLREANKKLQHPKITLRNDQFPIKLQLASERAKIPGSVNISNGKSFNDPANVWYGRLMPNGELSLKRDLDSKTANTIRHQLAQFQNDPLAYAKIYGDATGECMYCCRKLTNPQSVAVGYGPICAENFNLPHGNLNLDDNQGSLQFSTIKDDELAEALNYLEYAIQGVHDAIKKLDSTSSDDARNFAMSNLESAYGILKSIGDNE